MNLLSGAYMKHWHSLTRTLSRNISSDLGHATAELSSKEPGGKKGGL